MTDVSDQLWAAFFRRLAGLTTEGPQLTEAEVLERKEEFVRAFESFLKVQ